MAQEPENTAENGKDDIRFGLGITLLGGVGKSTLISLSNQKN